MARGYPPARGPRWRALEDALGVVATNAWLDGLPPLAGSGASHDDVIRALAEHLAVPLVASSHPGVRVVVPGSE